MTTDIFCHLPEISSLLYLDVTWHLTWEESEPESATRMWDSESERTLKGIRKGGPDPDLTQHYRGAWVFTSESRSGNSLFTGHLRMRDEETRYARKNSQCR